MHVTNNYLFNFSVSYTGGGYKRLYNYVKVFNAIGGAHFIVNPRCVFLLEKFPNNSYHIVEQSKFKRLLNINKYLSEIVASIGTIDFYYSYGIPISYKVARLNWFHLSNVLPLVPNGIPMAPLDQIKMRLLCGRIKRNLINADVVSAESNYSLGLFGSEVKRKLFLSVNGSDDELKNFVKDDIQKKSDIAVVLGTHRYKAIRDSFHVYEMLRRTKCHNLKLVITGSAKQIPKDIASDPNVIVKGFLSREQLIGVLRDARYYISTTYIENSYNAASEGVFFADESYISCIEPHLELLHSMPYKAVSIPEVNRSILHIKKKDINCANIKSWENVISEMLEKIHEVM